MFGIFCLARQISCPTTNDFLYMYAVNRWLEDHNLQVNRAI